MKVHLLIDQPGIHWLLGPIAKELADRKHDVAAFVVWKGCVDGLAGVYVCESKELVTDGFFDCDRIVLASDLNVDSHEIGRCVCEKAREKGIPSISVQHAPYWLYEMSPKGVHYHADLCLVWTTFEEFMYAALGRDNTVSVGNPKYDVLFQARDRMRSIGDVEGGILVANVGHVKHMAIPAHQVVACYSSGRVVYRPHPTESALRSTGRMVSSQHIAYDIATVQCVMTPSPSVYLEATLLRRPCVLTCRAFDEPLDERFGAYVEAVEDVGPGSAKRAADVITDQAAL